MADSNVPYLKLITSEHSVQPKYTSFVKTFLDMISPIVNIYNDFDVLFALDYAAGDQLDKLGELVGIGRKLPIVDAMCEESRDRRVEETQMRTKVRMPRPWLCFFLSSPRRNPQTAARNNFKTHSKINFVSMNFSSK